LLFVLVLLLVLLMVLAQPVADEIRCKSTTALLSKSCQHQLTRCYSPLLSSTQNISIV
jgi:hypothetical protein